MPQPERDHAAYILNPTKWVAYPFCPLKRRSVVPGRLPDTAYLSSTSIDAQGRIQLYHGNMFVVTPDDHVEVFTNVHALLAAGWEVD